MNRQELMKHVYNGVIPAPVNDNNGVADIAGRAAFHDVMYICKKVFIASLDHLEGKI